MLGWNPLPPQTHILCLKWAIPSSFTEGFSHTDTHDAIKITLYTQTAHILHTQNYKSKFQRVGNERQNLSFINWLGGTKIIYAEFMDIFVII